MKNLLGPYDFFNTSFTVFNSYSSQECYFLFNDKKIGMSISRVLLPTRRRKTGMFISSQGFYFLLDDKNQASQLENNEVN